MTLINADPDRQVVPRWRDFLSALVERELLPLGDNSPSIAPMSAESEDFFVVKKQQWEDHRTFSFASDLVSSAIVLGRESEAREAAEYVLQNGQRHPVAVALARQVLGLSNIRVNATIEMDVDALRLKAHELRLKLRETPRNAFRWADLARVFETLGESDKAFDCLKRAGILAPQNRFIMRSTARMFLHHDDYERANSILARSLSVRHDPWILASEIATAAATGRTSVNVHRAKDFLEKQQFAPVHTSELGVALSTLEFEAGNFKRARKLLRQSLTDPSENAFAQASWLARKMGVETVMEPLVGAPPSFEAKAWESRFRGEWTASLTASTNWLMVEPFSSRPAILGSFIAAVALAEYEQSAEIAGFGLLANHDNFTLRNNLCYAFAKGGQLQRALTQYSAIDEFKLTNPDRVTWLATGGLLKFRENNFDEGRKLYEQAIETALKHDLKPHAAAAFLFYLIEEISHGSTDAQKQRADILKSLDGKKIAELFHPILHRLRETIPLVESRHRPGMLAVQGILPTLRRSIELVEESLPALPPPL